MQDVIVNIFGKLDYAGIQGKDFPGRYVIEQRELAVKLKGSGLWPPRRHVFGTGGQQSAGSILKRRDTEKRKNKIK